MTAVRARVWRCRRCGFEWENTLPATLGAYPHRHDDLPCKGPMDPVDPVPAQCPGQMTLAVGA